MDVEESKAVAMSARKSELERCGRNLRRKPRHPEIELREVEGISPVLARFTSEIEAR